MRRIRQIEPELRAKGMAALYIFGSTARGEAGPASDVDLICEIAPDSDLDLLDFIGLQHDLVDHLGIKVDLVERVALRPRIRSRAESEMVRIF